MMDGLRGTCHPAHDGAHRHQPNGFELVAMFFDHDEAMDFHARHLGDGFGYAGMWATADQTRRHHISNRQLVHLWIAAALARKHNVGLRNHTHRPSFGIGDRNK